MKILGTSETVRYVGFDVIDKTGIAKAGFTVKCDKEWTYRLIAREIGTKPEMTVHPKEAHTCNVKQVSSLNGGEGTLKPSTLVDTDGMITNERGLALCMIMSDCAAVYLVDPIKRCIGLCHSGRNGTQGNIVATTVKMMTEYYGSVATDIVAAISPSICKNCYEVDALTAEKYAGCFKEEWRKDIVTNQNGKYFIDIACTIYKQLKETGVQTIQMPEYCTCHNEKFFSYRGGDGVESNAAWLMLT